VLLCLAGGAEAVPGATALEKMHRIVSEGWKPELPQRVPQMHALLTRMLSSDPAQRPTMAEAAAALKVIPQLDQFEELEHPETIPSPTGEGGRRPGEGPAENHQVQFGRSLSRRIAGSSCLARCAASDASVAAQLRLCDFAARPPSPLGRGLHSLVQQPARR
jgi:serine/threonine protein kinase